MGIHGIYKEIGGGRRIALSKYSVEHYEKHSRPLRLAIDTQIWLFQIQSGKGGTNPALRTFYYRLLRLLSLNIYPLFVFDGPNKPLFKRNKRVGGPGVKVASVPEFLAKQLLKQFGFPMHIAPGEAEAECAHLQCAGVVDAVLSEDVDTLMFGSGTTMRSWTAEAKSSKVPTHVNVYDSHATKEKSGLDREGMILVALMSGGDYIPEGIPGCGPKTACEAARAGFGSQLCRLRKRDDAGFKEWRERLKHELWTNESKLLKSRRRLDIPDDFPNREVLGYYTNPAVSSPEKVEDMRKTLKWDMPIDFVSLRSFAGDAFDWICIGGAKKFIRNLAPAVLMRELRLRAEQGANAGHESDDQDSAESRLVIAIHGKRTHASTDNTAEIRVSFLPINLVPIDLSTEPPDEVPLEPDSESENAGAQEEAGEQPDAPDSPRKRGPPKYNPEDIEKMWILDSFLRQGVPLKVQDWEASFRDPKNFLAARRAAKTATSRAKGTGMPRGALDRFAIVTKPGVDRDDRFKASNVTTARPDRISEEPRHDGDVEVSRPQSAGDRMETVDLSTTQKVRDLPMPPKRPSSESLSPAGTRKTKKLSSKADVGKNKPTIIDLLSSPRMPSQRAVIVAIDTPTTLHDLASCSRRESNLDDAIDLPSTVTRRRKRSPLKRYETAPAILLDYESPTLNHAVWNAALSEDELELPDLMYDPNLPPGALRRFSRDCRPVVESSTRPESSENEINTNMTTSMDEVDLTSASIATNPRPHRAILGSVIADAVTIPSTNGPVQKRHYQLRESLEGHFREVTEKADMVDLPSGHSKTGSIMKEFASTMPNVGTGSLRGAALHHSRTRWRHSEVEVLDLTAA